MLAQSHTTPACSGWLIGANHIDGVTGLLSASIGLDEVGVRWD